MATTQRVTRLANPRRKAARTRKRNSSGRRAARNRSGQFVKASKARKRPSPKRRRTRRANPVLLTLGAVNPRPATRKRRTTKVARRRRRTASATPRRRRRRANPVAAPRRRRRTVAVRRRRRRRSNPVALVTRRRRRNYSRRRRSNPRRYSRRRNPSIAGSLSLVEKGVGVLIGVTAAKLIPTYLPAQFISSPIMRIIATGASAYLASMLIGKVRHNMTDAVLLGGFAQTVSVALNTFLPSIGSQIGLSGYRGGMGDFVAGSFAVPQNPIVFPAPPMPAQARIPMNGLARSFGSAF
jgi:hypothetical protein